MEITYIVKISPSNVASKVKKREVKIIAKLKDEWYYGFNGNFETEEDVIEFIFERLNTSDFKDSYIDAGGYGEPNEMFKVTAEAKKQLLYDFIMSLIDG